MPFRLNIFSKIVILLLLLLCPILILYGLTNQITNRVVQEQIESANLNQLSFFLHQLDANIEQLSMFPVILGYDPYIREYIDQSGSPGYDRLKAQSRIQEKLSLQSVSGGWRNELTLALTKEHTALSSSIFLNGADLLSTNRPIYRTWMYDSASGRNGSFIREVGEPFRAETLYQTAALYQVRFDNQNIIHLLDVYKQDRRSDPFLYHADYPSIMNSTSDAGVTASIIARLAGQPLSGAGQQLVDIDRQRYLVSYVGSAQLAGWFLIDYVPVQKIMSPITMSRNLFYVTIGLLLIMSILAAFLLYRNVQVPIINMIRSVQKMKRGDLSTRIAYHAKNEFDYLIQRFNEMAEQIQVLIEDVYAERIRSREATLKHLQAQIHPHFLYNSLFFIINSAELGDKESVVAMSQNLAEFYRYTTRAEKQTVTLREEVEHVRHYLNIQNLRIHRLHFDISVPDEMLGERVPRLILQPLVENAIVHGIDKTPDGDRITITGGQDERFNRIVVEDNGAGLSKEELKLLVKQLDDQMSDEIGCGTWNVHHRLYYEFGEGSGLAFEHGDQGGLRAILTWSRGTAQLPHTTVKEHTAWPNS
ncbi:sensor histidine kinase [Paenibacillus chartarius]|uniref:Sensor histidine kinase n=1 Tax=Paenibacillus chartarius TaxID=747481 RepID=A0ABV6DQK5_9BACL